MHVYDYITAAYMSVMAPSIVFFELAGFVKLLATLFTVWRVDLSQGRSWNRRDSGKPLGRR